jgi:hypothetical protein
MNIDNLVSPRLRAALRTHGWAKLAFEVVYRRGGYPPAAPTLPEAVKALAMKIAVDHVNQSIIRDGITAYKELYNLNAEKEWHNDK